MLRDPSLLFWNRAARANKLYKSNDYEPACEGYALAEAEMERMASKPSADNVATFYFNYGRSCQGGSPTHPFSPPILTSHTITPPSHLSPPRHPHSCQIRNELLLPRRGAVHTRPRRQPSP